MLNLFSVNENRLVPFQKTSGDKWEESNMHPVTLQSHHLKQQMSDQCIRYGKVKASRFYTASQLLKTGTWNKRAIKRANNISRNGLLSLGGFRIKRNCLTQPQTYWSKHPEDNWKELVNPSAPWQHCDMPQDTLLEKLWVSIHWIRLPSMWFF